MSAIATHPPTTLDGRGTAATAAGNDRRPLRARIRQDLPAATFERRPWRALWVLPLMALVTALGTWIVVADPAWYLALPAALLMGNTFAQLGFLAHESMHGALVKPRWLQTAIGYAGFAPFLVSPDLWRKWHNVVHHGNTNKGDRDPDSFGTMKRYERVPSTRFVTRLAPGSGRWYSWLFLGYWFSFHAQVVLWIQAKYMRGFEGYRRGRAIAETFLFAGLWGAVAWAAGFPGLLYVMVIPMVVGNAIVMSYISTNHFLRPQGDGREPVDDSMSVRTPRWLDALHFHFSHHVEHHMFPKMPSSQAPKVRSWLEEHAGDRYVAPPHWLAVKMLYETPRVYLDAHTLVDPDDGHTVGMDVVHAKLGFEHAHGHAGEGAA